MAAWYGKDYVRLQQEIRALSVKDLKSYDINYVSNKVKTLPPEIGRLADLQRLRISGARSLEILPEEIGKLKELTRLYILYTGVKQFPEAMKKLQNLQILELVGLKFDKSTNLDFLSSLKNLKRLVLRTSIRKTESKLPIDLFKIPSLVYLDISGNKINELPSQIAKLQELETLSLSGNNFPRFPKVLIKLPKLCALKINTALLDSIPKELEALPQNLIIETEKQTKRSFNSTLILQIFQVSKELSFTNRFRGLLLKILRNSSTELKKLKEATLFELLNCKIEHFENAALAELTTRGEQKKLLDKNLIDKNSNVFVLGKVVSNRELTQHIKQYGAHIRRKFSPKITHIVVGKQGQEQYRLLDEKNIVGVTEKMLINYFNKIEKPYLIHTPTTQDLEQNIENIRALLYSKNPENIDLAFGLLSGGGFPKALLVDMLLVYKGPFKAKHRTKASKYIEQYGSADLLAGVKRRFLLWGYIQPSTLSKTIGFYSKFEDIDKVELIELLYIQGQKRVIASVLDHFPSKKKIEFIKTCIKDGVLDWADTELKTLPDELALFKEDIQELNLNGCHFKAKFPAIVLKLKNVHTIHIRNKWWQRERFPKQLLKMPKLKHIHIDRRKTGLPNREELKAHDCQLHIS
ncbi:MAG: hypothetical protein GY810_29910 [Aureispira sp.]|nr:hypothetical protein [Aureispira sp.]